MNLPRGPFIHAYHAGQRAKKDRRPRSSCPYRDIRNTYHNGKTFSQAWITAWLRGYDESPLTT